MSRTHDTKEDDIAEWEEIIKKYSLVNRPGVEHDTKKLDWTKGENLIYGKEEIVESKKKIKNKNQIRIRG